MTEIAEVSAIPVKKAKKSKSWLFILAGLIVINVIAVMFYKPISPRVSVPSESLVFDASSGEIVAEPWFTLPFFGPVYLTNSLLAVAVVYILILLLALEVHRQTKDGQLQSHGIVLGLECLISMLTNMADCAVDKKWRKTVYKYYLGIFLYVLITNLSKLLPFYETFGFVVPVAEHGYLADKWTSWFYAIKNQAAVAGETGYELISFLRGASTDLNFTLSLAVFAVIAIQVVGVQAKGIGYFNKYFNFRALIKNPKMGFIDFLIGILELFAEMAKILSFGFRLFGNMFAGMVLLMFLGFVIPYVVSSGIMLYEIFVGILQAFIFGILTTVFMGMAVAPSEH